MPSAISKDILKKFLRENSPDIFLNYYPKIEIPVATALHRAEKEQKKLFIAALHLNKTGDSPEKGVVDLYVRQLVTRDRGDNDTTYVISFLDSEEAKYDHLISANSYNIQQEAKQRIVDRGQELSASRDSLRTAVEELETTNEELQSTNEELMSANEELQSTNEELQSVNEELHGQLGIPRENRRINQHL